MNISDKIYYAHSMRIYNTKQEEKELKFLNNKFDNVINPNGGMSASRSMDPYLREVDSCAGVVCSEFEKHIGRGVYEEIQHALSKDKRVYRIYRRLGKLYLKKVRGVKVVNPRDWAVKYGKLI